MNNSEWAFAEQIVAKGNTTLAVQALTEANEELQGEIKRLRNTNRVLRAANHAVRGKAEDLMKQIEDTNAHLFDIAANEVEEISDNQTT